MMRPFFSLRVVTLSKDLFTLWGAFEIVEKGDDTDAPLKRGQIKGLASSQAKDADGEIVVQDGISWDYFLSKGFISLEHPLGVGNIVGEPTNIERLRIDGVEATSLTADLFLTDSSAQQVWEKARTLKKADSKRRLGFSIEGRAISRAGNRIDKSEVLSVAISPVPKNPHTWFEPIMASMMYRALAGNPGLVTGFGGTGDFAPTVPQSLQGAPLATATFNPDMETTLITRLLRKLPQLSWEQGEAAIKLYLGNKDV